MPFFDLRFLLKRKSAEHFAQMPPQLLIQRLAATFRDEDNMIFAVPSWWLRLVLVHRRSPFCVSGCSRWNFADGPPETSNCYCHPGIAGGSPADASEDGAKGGCETGPPGRACKVLFGQPSGENLTLGTRRSARQTAGIDPKQAFPLGPRKGRNAQEAGVGRRLGERDKWGPLLPFPIAQVRQEGARSGRPGSLRRQAGAAARMTSGSGAGRAGRSPCVSQDRRAAVSSAVMRPTVLIMDGPGRLARTRRHRDGVGSGGKRPGDPETQVVVPVDGGVPDAVRRAEADWTVVPGTAADDAGAAIAARPWRAVGRRSRRSCRSNNPRVHSQTLPTIW